MPKPISIRLPQPKLQSSFSLEKALHQRKSYRAYKKTHLSVGEISQLLFAGQGIIKKRRKRTVPSAGALYPVEIYLVSGKIKGIPPGVYKYQPKLHRLIKILNEDKRKELLKATLFQFWIEEAPAVIVLCGVFWKTLSKYGREGNSFVFMEIGHTAQNISLQATSLNLGTVCIGGFKKRRVEKALSLAKDEKPLYLIPVGNIFKDYQKNEAKVLKKYRRLLQNFFLSENQNYDKCF